MTGDETVEVDQTGDVKILRPRLRTVYATVLDKIGLLATEELYVGRESRLKMDQQFTMGELHHGAIKFQIKMELMEKKAAARESVLYMEHKKRTARRHNKNRMAKQSRKRNR